MVFPNPLHCTLLATSDVFGKLTSHFSTIFKDVLKCLRACCMYIYWSVKLREEFKEGSAKNDNICDY